MDGSEGERLCPWYGGALSRLIDIIGLERNLWPGRKIFVGLGGLTIIVKH